MAHLRVCSDVSRARIAVRRAEPHRRGRARRRVVDPRAALSRKSALDGAPRYVEDGTLTPDFHAVNTMQPPYQPSGNPAGARWGSTSRRSGHSHDAAAADGQHHWRPSFEERHQLGLVWRRVAGRAQRRPDGAAGRSSSTISRSTISRPWRLGRAEREPNTSKTAASTASSSSRRSMPATFRRWFSTSPRAISTSTRALRAVHAGDRHIADVIDHLSEASAVAAHDHHRDVRRERRLLGPCRAAER